MAQMSQTETDDQTKCRDKKIVNPDTASSNNNKMFMKIFVNRLSGREQTETVPPMFVEAASLITHGDFTNEEKLLLTYGMAHYTGCLIC